MVSVGQTPELHFQVRARSLHDSRSGAKTQFGFSASERFFFTIDKKYGLTVREMNGLHEVRSVRGKVLEARFSPRRNDLAVVYKKSVTVLDLDSGKQVERKFKHRIRVLGWSPDGEVLAIANKEFDITIINGKDLTTKASRRFRKPKSRWRIFSKIIERLEFYIISAVFVPGRDRVLIVDRDSTSHYWDYESNRIIAELDHRGLSTRPDTEAPGIGFGEASNDGRWLATSTSTETALWEAETGSLVRVFERVHFPRFSPRSRYLGLLDKQGGPRQVELWDLPNNRQVEFLKEYSGGLVAWHPKDESFLTDRTRDEASKEEAYIWDVKTGARKAKIETESSWCFDLVSTCRSDWDVFRFGPHGDLIMVYRKNNVALLDAEDGSLVATLDGVRSPAIWSPSGGYVFARSKDGKSLKLFRIR